MSDYYWRKDSNKDGVTFSDTIKKLGLKQNEAMNYLKSQGIAINSYEDTLTYRQFQSLKHLSHVKIHGEILEHYDELCRKKKEEQKECKKYLQMFAPPTIGINNHKIESKDELKSRLTEIAKCPTEYFIFDGAMCYSRRFPNIEATIEHKCATCGTVYKYKSYTFGEREAADRYSDEESKIDQYIKEIKRLGYDVKVDHMCENCYEKKYGKNEKGVSINVLNFRHSGELDAVISIVNSLDCYILAEFLKGNNAFKGSQDQTIWINKYRSIVERIIGIKIEE